MKTLDSPVALAERLGLDPSEAQKALMDQFASLGHHSMECAGDAESTVDKAVALSCLWRLLSVPGSGVLVTAPTRRDAEQFLSFMERITQEIDPAIEQQTTWPRWNVMRVHGKIDWTMRYVSPVPAYVDEMSRIRAQTIVALGARSSNPEWMEMDAKIQGVWDNALIKVVRVW